ncbi:MAG: hypothetical protein QM802_02260 [Agriterribacter sp.]
MSEKFDLAFVYNNEKLNAICEKQKGGRYLQFNVYVKKQGTEEEVYNFLEVNRAGKKIAWFNHSQQRNQMSAIIAKALIESTRPKKPERPSKLRPVLIYLIISIRNIYHFPGQVKAYLHSIKHDFQEILAEADKVNKRMVN